MTFLTRSEPLTQSAPLPLLPLQIHPPMKMYCGIHIRLKVPWAYTRLGLQAREVDTCCSYSSILYCTGVLGNKSNLRYGGLSVTNARVSEYQYQRFLTPDGGNKSLSKSDDTPSVVVCWLAHSLMPEVWRMDPTVYVFIIAFFANLRHSACSRSHPVNCRPTVGSTGPTTGPTTRQSAYYYGGCLYFKRRYGYKGSL
jgi:hypothetical protein